MKRGTHILILLMLLLWQMGKADERKVVTIFPFHFASTNPQEKAALEELNNFFYDLFAGQLTSTDYFEVVDRQNMKALLEEVALQQSGLTQQVVQLGKMKGAQLAIFGTVTKIGKQTYLTMKIIDIETGVILKAIKQKGSLKKPDELATEAGFKFMNGLSKVLYQRYGIGVPTVSGAAKKGLRELLRARDSIQKAIVAAEADDTRNLKKWKKEAEKHLQKASRYPELSSQVRQYREALAEL